jgi:hypothetical protein
MAKKTKKAPNPYSPWAKKKREEGTTFRSIFPGHWLDLDELSGDGVKLWLFFRMTLGPYGFGLYHKNDAMEFLYPLHNEDYSDHNQAQREAYFEALKELREGGFVEIERKTIYLVEALANDLAFTFSDPTGNHAKGFIKNLGWAGAMGLKNLTHLCDSVELKYPKEWKELPSIDPTQTLTVPSTDPTQTLREGVARVSEGCSKGVGNSDSDRDSDRDSFHSSLPNGRASRNGSEAELAGKTLGEEAEVTFGDLEAINHTPTFTPVTAGFLHDPNEDEGVEI